MTQREKAKAETTHWTWRVMWSPEDAEWVGLCAEFPSLSWLAANPDAALRGIRRVVAEVVADMQRAGEPLPTPIAMRRYSGRMLVRVPPEVHRRLTIEAAEAGVSLNRLIAARLG